MLGLVDTHDFHLVKLVQAVESPYVLAIGTSLAAEAGRVSAALDRQLLLVQYLVAEDVGDGHLRRGYQVEVVQIGVIHLSLLIGQLSRAVTAGLVDHVWGLHLHVARLAGLVKEESLQYLKNWSIAISEDPKLIFTAVAKASAAANMICRELKLEQSRGLDMSDLAESRQTSETLANPMETDRARECHLRI